MQTRPLKIAVVAMVAALVGGTAVAWADHQWGDVPSGSFFHDSIGAITDAGCAVGYADSTFRPEAEANRGQFAYWMNNCGGRLAFGEGIDNFSVPDAAADDVATAAMTSGAQDPGNSLVVAVATIQVDTSGDQQSTWTLDRSANGGGKATLDDGTVSVVTPAGATLNPSDTITLMASEPMGAGDTYTFTVSGVRVNGVPLANIDVELAVTTYPFDGNGEGSGPPI